MIELNPGESVAQRITVIDAGELDSAIFGIVKSQFDSATKYLPAWILNRYGLELEMILKMLIWKLSIGKHNASFGQQLLRLKYSENSCTQQNLKTLAFLNIGIPYLKEKFISHFEAEENSHSRKVFNLMEGVDSTFKILNILTFVRFLARGGPSTFLELVLHLNPVSTVPQSKRNVGYTYMTRELIWHGFIELLLILLPLVNYHKLKRYISKMFYGSSTKPLDVKKCMFSAGTLCEICKEPPISPQEMGCGHAFCYICLASNREADIMFPCPGCGFSNPDPIAMQPVQINLLPRLSPMQFNEELT